MNVKKENQKEKIENHIKRLNLTDNDLPKVKNIKSPSKNLISTKKQK